jgi:hypothetical protein
VSAEAKAIQKQMVASARGMGRPVSNNATRWAFLTDQHFGQFECIRRPISQPSKTFH